MVAPKLSIFRACDIRGLVGESITEDEVFSLGLAIGSQVLLQGENTIILARDGRISGPQFTKVLKTALLASGCDVIDIGMVPTPLMYYATCRSGITSGVMITASHNPPDYNGFKIVIAGEALYEEKLLSLRDRAVKQEFFTGDGQVKYQSFASLYIDDIASRFRCKRKLKVAIDCGNGATAIIAPLLFRALGHEVVPLFAEVDGSFPNHYPNPSDPQNLQKLRETVIADKCDIGLAFDGDGDRLGIIDSNGKIIWPDRVLGLFAIELLARKPGSTIIYDIKSSKNLAGIIKENNGVPVLWKTGHSLIKAKMRSEQAELAGEMSGHFFFQDGWYGFDDGLYAGARLLNILAANEATTAEVFAQIPDSVNTPELTLSVPDEDKFYIMQLLKQNCSFQGAEIIAIDGIRVDYPFGWGLVRASNSMPNLTFRFEADNVPGLLKIQAIFKQEISPLLTEELPF